MTDNKTHNKEEKSTFIRNFTIVFIITCTLFVLASAAILYIRYTRQ